MSLLEATRKKDLKKVLELISAGANLDIQDKDGNTALIFASWNRHHKIGLALIAAGANLNIQDKRGYCFLGRTL